MERLKHMKETLIGCVQAQLSDIREEKQLLEKKVSALVTRISSLNHA